MMGDLKKRASFAKLVNYVNNPKKARLIDSKDVRLDNNATIAASMQGQADDKPGRKLKNPVSRPVFLLWHTCRKPPSTPIWRTA